MCDDLELKLLVYVYGFIYISSNDSISGMKMSIILLIISGCGDGVILSD